MRSKKNKSAGKPTMIGKFFHSFPEDKMCWQGVIIAEPKPNVYLCQLFSWIMGEASDQVFIPLEQMITEKFKFYDDEEYWRYKGDENSRRNIEEGRAKAGLTQ